ncbi:MAG TPA: hypothetical protein VGM87_04560, partial [Roseomonas sp.]
DGEALAPGSMAGRSSLNEAVARLPGEAAGLRRAGISLYEQRQPGFGAGVDYQAPSRTAIATVYLYDRGHGAVPSDPASPQVTEEFARVIQEVNTGAQRGGRRLVELERFELPVSGGRGLHCVLLQGSSGSAPVLRQVCLGGGGGRFVQSQVTMAAQQPPPADARAFAAAVTRAARRPSQGS